MQILISPCQKQWMPDLEKLEILIYTQKCCYAGYKITANYLLFPTSNLIEMKQCQILYPTVELENLGMSKDYVPLTYIKSKSK